MTTEDFQNRFISADDGLKLYLRDYGTPKDRPPIVCLPGLTRNSADFHELALALRDAGHRVLCLDLRGRGLSGRDPDPDRYTVNVELADVLHVLETLGIAQAVIVGTSRGGLIGLALAAARPGMLRGIVLNDIGPVIETRGLMRLRGYVGKLRPPRDEADAATMLKELLGEQFPDLTDAQWCKQARTTFIDRGGALAANYDPALANALQAIEPQMPSPTLWPLFDALEGIPVLVIRGGLSDLLSDETLGQMQARRPDLEHFSVPRQGHAPHLDEPVPIARIAAFVDKIR